ncbi:MAG: Crp/Fnr family transcriptional regulator [Dehalococcoidia bacterium]
MAASPSGQHLRYLRDVPLLARLSREDADALGSRGNLRRFSVGETIFHEGDEGDSLHVLIEGRVRVSVVSEDGGETTLATFRAGDCFGELSVLDGLPRSATAQAVEATRTLVVTRRAFHAWLRERPSAGEALLTTLSLNLRDTDDRLTDQLFLSLERRLARLLLAGSSGGRPFEVRRTQRSLGDELGVSRESVNKTLRKLESRQLVELGRGSVTVVDPEGLRLLS